MRFAKRFTGRNHASQPAIHGSANERAVAANIVFSDPVPPPLATKCWTHQDRSVARHKSTNAQRAPSEDCQEKSRRRLSPALIVRSQLSAITAQYGSSRFRLSGYRNPAASYLDLTLSNEAVLTSAPNACQSTSSSIPWVSALGWSGFGFSADGSGVASVVDVILVRIR